MTKTNCDGLWSFGHQWGKWEVKARADITKNIDGRQGSVGWIMKQERQCLVCGFVEMNVQRETL